MMKDYVDGIKIAEDNIVEEIAKDHSIGRPMLTCAYKSLRLCEYIEECERVISEMMENE